MTNSNSGKRNAKIGEVIKNDKKKILEMVTESES